jgi:hypothetical protein
MSSYKRRKGHLDEKRAAEGENIRQLEKKRTAGGE